MQGDISFDQPDDESVTDPEGLFKEPLSLGSEGLVIVALKNFLSDLGYYEGSEDEVFDDNTWMAVIKFQRENGLNADGVVDQDMWSLLLSPEAKPMPK